MIDSVGSLLNSVYSAPFTGGSSVSSTSSSLFDYKTAQSETKTWIDSYKTNNAKVSQLKKNTADFLDNYTKQMNSVNSAAGALTNGGIDKLLYDENGEVTEDTIKATVDAAKQMVDAYNNARDFLSKNTDRGYGVENQLDRMSDNPATKNVMEMLGMSVNSDGSLALDTKKLTEALSTENVAQRDLYKDILGGSNGIASALQRDANAGLNRSSISLVAGDIAEMQSAQSEDPIRSFAQSMRGYGAYGYNNMAAVGILMNMTV